MGTNLTTVQAAQRINVAESTMRYWHQRGEGPKSFKIGRRRMYDSDVIEKFIADAAAAEESE